MSDRVRIADLPSSSVIDKDSYMIVERPGQGEGTYKTTLGEIQEAITVRAKVEQVDKTTTIYVKDITGEYEASIITPTAKVVDNGNNTATITITDTDGTTETSLVTRVVMDSHPTEDSPNLISSGEVWKIANEQQTDEGRITDLETNLADAVRQLQALVADFSNFQQATEDRLDTADEVLARAVVVEDNQEIDMPFSIGGGIRFSSLEDAILASHARGTDIKLFSNAHSAGLSVPESLDFTIDLNGYELTISGPGVGPEGEENIGLQLLKDTNATIKNGRLQFTGGDTDALPLLTEDDQYIITEYGEDLLADVYLRGNLQIGISNYCNLTLDNVQVSGNEQILYLIFNSFGNTSFKNNTSFIPAESNVAFNAFYGSAEEYDRPGVFVTLEDDSIGVTGKVEFGKADRAAPYYFKRFAGITTPEDFDLDVDILTPPCNWVINGDGTKTLMYSGI